MGFRIASSLTGTLACLQNLFLVVKSSAFPVNEPITIPWPVREFCSPDLVWTIPCHMIQTMVRDHQYPQCCHFTFLIKHHFACCLCHPFCYLPNLALYCLVCFPGQGLLRLSWHGNNQYYCQVQLKPLLSWHQMLWVPWNVHSVVWWFKCGLSWNRYCTE